MLSISRLKTAVISVSKTQSKLSTTTSLSSSRFQVSRTFQTRHLSDTKPTTTTNSQSESDQSTTKNNTNNNQNNNNVTQLKKPRYGPQRKGFNLFELCFQLPESGVGKQLTRFVF